MPKADKQVRMVRTGTENVCGLNSLLRAFKKAEGDPMIPHTTIRNHLREFLAIDGTRNLVFSSATHNACPMCKTLDTLRADAVETLLAKSLGVKVFLKESVGHCTTATFHANLEALCQQRAEARRVLDAVDAEFASHDADDKNQRRLTAFLLVEALLLRESPVPQKAGSVNSVGEEEVRSTAAGVAAATESGAGGVGGGRSRALPESGAGTGPSGFGGSEAAEGVTFSHGGLRVRMNIVDGVLIVHIDGETSRQFPHVKKSTTQEQMSGWRTSNMGAYDMCNNTMHNILMDLGVGKEDANVLVTLILMTMLQKSEGQNACVILADCCAVGNCGLIDWLCAFVVDELKWFDVCGIVYYWNSHGKSAADTRFAQHLKLYMASTVFSLDMYAELLETVVNKKTHEHDTSSILHATAISNWAEYAFRKTGGRVPYPSYVE